MGVLPQISSVQKRSLFIFELPTWVCFKNLTCVGLEGGVHQLCPCGSHHCSSSCITPGEQGHQPAKGEILMSAHPSSSSSSSSAPSLKMHQHIQTLRQGSCWLQHLMIIFHSPNCALQRCRCCSTRDTQQKRRKLNNSSALHFADGPWPLYTSLSVHEQEAEAADFSPT